MRKLVREKMLKLKINLDKDPEFRIIFEKNFELVYDVDETNIKVLCKYKSSIPKEYLNNIYDNYKYRDKIISTFADYAKRNNIETIEYNSPACDVELPYIFNEEYEKREERARKNKECSQIISEITRKMNKINEENNED